MMELTEDRLEGGCNAPEDDQLWDDISTHLSPKIKKNLLVWDVLLSACYRILYVPSTEDPHTSSGYWIRIDSTSNVPQPFDPSDVTERLKIGALIITADTAVNDTDETLKPKSAARRDRAWNLIHNIVTLEPDIYIKSKRTDLLKAVETASGVKITHLYDYLGRYWRGGFRISALNPGYDKCGGVRQAQDLSQRAGRHKRAGANGKVLAEKDYEHFSAAIQQFYLDNPGTSLMEAYQQMLARDYVRCTEDGSSFVTMGADEKPSYGQFYYWYNKNKDVVGDTLAREGEYNFNLKHRAILGRSETGLFGPGDCYHVDATIGDFNLVMKSDRSRLVGRPIIVIFKDVWSRMVTGLAITLENSSCRVWKMALMNAICPKQSFCQRFGIEIQEEEWPCSVLPVSITTDNGEFAVQAVDAIVKDLGIIVENCPPYRGDLKGIIERVFGTVQLKLRPYIPGYVDKDAGERGAEDYRKNSCLDYDSFVAIFIKVILYYNNHHYMKKYHRTDDMREKGIPAVPIHLWNYGIAHRTGVLGAATVDLYANALLEKGDATITAQGIRLNGLYYTCSEAQAEKWFEKARVSGNYEIPVRYNPFDLDRIFLKKSDGKYTTCLLTNANADRYGHDTETLEAGHEEDLNAQASFTQEEDQAYLEMIQFIKAVAGRCEKEKEAGQVIIKTLKRHSVMENREEEKRNISGEAQARQSQAAMGLFPPSSSPGPVRGGAQDRTKAYSAVSEEIDRMLEGLGLGNRGSSTKE